MAEVAGLVLGAIPIVIWALEKYAEPYSEYRNSRRSIETLRAGLVLQNRQLQTTLRNVGLEEQCSLNDLQECFQTKFPDICKELTSLVIRMNDIILELMKHLDIETSGESNSLPEKAQWEWRSVKHGFQSKRRREIINELRLLNDDLRRGTEKIEVPAEDESSAIHKLQLRFSKTRCSEIRQRLSSLHRALTSGFQCACSPTHQAAIDLNWKAYEEGGVACFQVAVSYQSNPQPANNLPDTWKRLHFTADARCEEESQAIGRVASLPSPQSRLVAARSPRGTLSPMSSLRSKMVRFGAHSLSRTPSLPSPMELSTAAAASLPIVEITRLCESVCTEQSPSDFAGSLKDPEDDRHQQFSVGHNKSDASVITRPVSLKRLLSSQSRLASKRDPYLSTSAKQRYGIAASIAWSVLHLGGSSWLCHRWEEEQTAIFVEKESGERERLSPYPCTSFDFSCTTSPAESPTDDINDFIPNRTVCALGVLLVELCMNKTMAELNDAPLDEASTTFLDDFKTARNNLNEVYNLAGDLYGNAAKRCLIFSFEGRDDHNDFDFSQFRQQFYDTVVAPLQATYHIFAQTHIP